MSTLTLDRYIIEVLMPDLTGHDHSPAAFVVYLYLWWQTAERGRVQLSYATIAADTGLSKTSAQRAISLLKKRKLVTVKKESATAVPEYRIIKPWLGRLP